MQLDMFDYKIKVSKRYCPQRDNRYSENWLRMEIWFDRDGVLTEKQKVARMTCCYAGGTRYTYLSSKQVRARGIIVRT